MLVAVVIIFVICWGPLLVFNVLTSFEIVRPLQPGPVKYLKTVFHLMAYFNRSCTQMKITFFHKFSSSRCVNPVVYGFMSKNFRESFSKALCCRKGTVRRQLSVSHTRTTSLRTYIN
ncbi:unnamed protein product [Nesidiocoris tenuis]|uniref:G-protein coupled receptors family 1 profile domain-containing protein n=1 Tax=Nesidiocoris tenuis TaxID=355587 RepID=A0A6H5GY48_9HEMI|nr:unnamed protein product [Nesidiocoris tenuis]